MFVLCWWKFKERNDVASVKRPLPVSQRLLILLMERADSVFAGISQRSP